MLPVSEFIEMARGGAGSEGMRERAPRRFSGIGHDSPVVIWNVCMHCNMHCPHCYAAAVAKPSPTDLTHDEGRHLLEELAQCGVRVVIFSGGEPLLRPDLFELLAYAKQLGISPQLSTNGTLIELEVAERLAATGVAYVGISIDGVKDFNDPYRGLEGGYEAALEGLRNARRAGMRTGLRMTLTRRNRDQLGAMVDVACGVEVDRLYISHLVYSGRGFKVAHDDLTREDARGALLELFARARELVEAESTTKVVTGSNDSDGVFLLRWLRVQYGDEAAERVRGLLLERGGNSAGERVLNVDSRGRVHPDQFWRAANLGDVREQPFAKILEHPMRDQLRNRLEHLKGRCGACAERDLCRGSHRERALAHYRDPWAPDPACVMDDSEIGLDASHADPLFERPGAA